MGAAIRLDGCRCESAALYHQIAVRIDGDSFGKGGILYRCCPCTNGNSVVKNGILGDCHLSTHGYGTLEGASFHCHIAGAAADIHCTGIVAAFQCHNGIGKNGIFGIGAALDGDGGVVHLQRTIDGMAAGLQGQFAFYQLQVPGNIAQNGKGGMARHALGRFVQCRYIAVIRGAYFGNRCLLAADGAGALGVPIVIDIKRFVRAWFPTEALAGGRIVGVPGMRNDAYIRKGFRCAGQDRPIANGAIL